MIGLKLINMKFLQPFSHYKILSSSHVSSRQCRFLGNGRGRSAATVKKALKALTFVTAVRQVYRTEAIALQYILVHMEEVWDPQGIVHNLSFIDHILSHAREARLTPNLDELSFAFFQQLSLKTGFAWTKLSISSGERRAWDWIPVLADSGRLLTTDCFSGVVNLGRVKQNGLARATGITGPPSRAAATAGLASTTGAQITSRAKSASIAGAP